MGPWPVWPSNRNYPYKTHVIYGRSIMPKSLHVYIYHTFPEVLPVRFSCSEVIIPLDLSFFLLFDCYSSDGYLFLTMFFVQRLITSASGPRRPHARGGASAHVTRLNLGSLAALLPDLGEKSRKKSNKLMSLAQSPKIQDNRAQYADAVQCVHGGGYCLISSQIYAIGSGI